MSIKKISSKKSSIKVRKTKSESYLVNKKYMGEEPMFKTGQMVSGSELMRCYNWYHIMSEAGDAKDYLVTYLTQQNRPADVKKCKTIPDNLLPMTACWIARLLSRGVTVPQTSIDFLNKTIAALEAREEKKPAVETEVTRPTIQENITEKVNEFIGKVETLIDAGEEFDLYKVMTADQFPARYVGRIKEFYEPFLEEAVLLVSGVDKELTEGFSRLSKKDKQLRVKMFENIIDSCDRYGSNMKKARAPRAKKPMSLDKKLKSFKFKQNDNELQLVSCNPADIIGASEVWLFNTGRNEVTVLRALDRGGLDVAKSSIINYDEKTSMSKKTTRKTAQKNVLTQVLNGGKIILRKLMGDLKGTAIDIQSKTNKNTIIMKVVK